jgi:hypothetical protein
VQKQKRYNERPEAIIVKIMLVVQGAISGFYLTTFTSLLYHKHFKKSIYQAKIKEKEG